MEKKRPKKTKIQIKEQKTTNCQKGYT